MFSNGKQSDFFPLGSLIHDDVLCTISSMHFLSIMKLMVEIYQNWHYRQLEKLSIATNPIWNLISCYDNYSTPCWHAP